MIGRIQNIHPGFSCFNICPKKYELLICTPSPLPIIIKSGPSNNFVNQLYLGLFDQIVAIGTKKNRSLTGPELSDIKTSVLFRLFFYYNKLPARFGKGLIGRIQNIHPGFTCSFSADIWTQKIIPKTGTGNSTFEKIPVE